MTPEESLLCEQRHQEYMQRREEFNEEVTRWFAEKYQPKATEINDQS